MREERAGKAKRGAMEKKERKAKKTEKVKGVKKRKGRKTKRRGKWKEQKKQKAEKRKGLAGKTDTPGQEPGQGAERVFGSRQAVRCPEIFCRLCAGRIFPDICCLPYPIRDSTCFSNSFNCSLEGMYWILTLSMQMLKPHFTSSSSTWPMLWPLQP